MHNSLNEIEIKDIIERMKGLNPSSYYSINSVAIDIFKLSEHLTSIDDTSIEWILLDKFKHRSSIVLLPLFFEDFSKETRTNIWRNRSGLDINSYDSINFIKSMLFEQLYRITQESELTYDDKILNILYSVFINNIDYSDCEYIDIVDDVKELFIYYMKRNNFCVYDLETKVVETIISKECSLSGLINLKNTLSETIIDRDIVVNLIFIAVTVLHSYKLIYDMRTKNQNNYLLQVMTHYKNIERMIRNE